jgi:hypothetical protein
VYLVHWNAPDWVSSATASILASDIDVQVHVVDNGPPEASDRLVLDPRVAVLEPGRNGGYSAGANVAVLHWRTGSAEWCVIGSHDLHVEPDTLRRLLEAGRAAPQVGILGPNVATNNAGRSLGTVDGIEERTAVSGTCLLLRRSCIDSIGGFDEDFGSYGEDNELCERARAAGWQVGRVLDAQARGLGSRVARRDARVRAGYLLLRFKTHGIRVALRLLLGDARRAATASFDLLRHGLRGLERRQAAADHLVGLARGLRIFVVHCARSCLRRFGAKGPAIAVPPLSGGSPHP